MAETATSSFLGAPNPLRDQVEPFRLGTVPKEYANANNSRNRPASTQVYQSAPQPPPSHAASQSARKRASHNVTTSQPQQQQEQVGGYRDVYSHPAAVAYAAAHPRRTIPKFGPYLLLQTLGEGEFGKVKLGLHCQWGEEVAVKLIRRGNIDTAVRMSKVEREIEVLRTIKHPNIVRLYDVIETDKYIGIILEYASGGELFDHILGHRYLKERDACKLFSQLISGVWYIHQKKIVHRDLKLENLLLDRHRNVIITDFGFANRFEHRADDLMQTSCGSPCYAAPELVISEGLYVGSAVDIWSCGVILYAMLAGYLPFDDDPANPDGDNINLLYRYIVNTPLTFPDYVSAEARDLLSIMLVPDPAKRATLDTLMKHSWMAPYAHLFERDVPDLERSAMEQHQQKRLAYQRQMKQQAVASAEQAKLQRSQSTRHDAASNGRHPPSAMNGEFLYETNAEDSIFSSPPPVPVAQPSARRQVASAIVGPSTRNAMEEDPFGPSPVYDGPITLPMPGDVDMDGDGRSQKSNKGARKNPPPTAIAPVKMSPERKKTADRQRHTLQLEYVEEPSTDAAARKAPPPAMPMDLIHRESPARNGSVSKAVKPLPFAPAAPSTNGDVTPTGSPAVQPIAPISDEEADAMEVQRKDALTPTPPIVSITPTSPPRGQSESTAPSSFDPERGSLSRSATGSVRSNGSDSSRSKHKKGISVDKLVGKIWGSGSDSEGASGLFANGSVKKRRTSEASTAGTLSKPFLNNNAQKRSTLQVAPSATPSSASKISSGSSDKSRESKNARRATLTGVFQPISKQIRQRSKTRGPPSEAGTEKEEAAKSSLRSAQTQSNQAQDSDSPSRFSPGRLEAPPMGTDIPASTSAASKVMQWFRYRSKSQRPSDAGAADASLTEDYEKIAHPDRDRSATPTGTQRSRVTSMQTPPKTTITPVGAAVPSVSATPKPTVQITPSIGSETSTPITPSVTSRTGAFGKLTNIIAPTPDKSGFNKKAMRVRQGAADPTMVSTGSPPDIMSHVTKELLNMGLEVQQETEYKLRVIRLKKRKGTSNLAAFNMVGSAASNGVDKRGLPVPSQASFSSGGMLKGLLMRRQSSQVSANSLQNAFTYEEGPDVPNTSAVSSKDKLPVVNAAGQEPIYGDRAVDQGDEVRFSVELARIDGLDGTFCLEIRRLKGNLTSYKFLYDSIRERSILSQDY